MNIEETLAGHYSNVEIDESSHRRLQEIVTDLAFTEQPRPGGLAAAGLAALVVVVGVALAVGGRAIVLHRSHERHAAEAVRTPDPVHTNTGPGLPHKAGFIGVENARGQVGLIRQSDSHAVEEHGSADFRTDRARQYMTVVLSLFDPTGRRVIGEWNVNGDRATVPINCPHHQGVAFSMEASVHVGHRSPVEAARTVNYNFDLAGFSDHATAWTVIHRTATAETLTSDTATVHVRRQSDGTWFVTRGQRCTT